jgi:signal transduction histidine kinase/CheY-like chemotaxis protein
LWERLERRFLTADIEEVRSRFLSLILVVSAVATVNGLFAPILSLCEPGGVPIVRATYGVWLVLHPLLWLLHRRRPLLARVTLLSGMTLVLLPNLAYLRAPVEQILATAIMFHTGNGLLALVLLRRRPLLVYVTVVTLLQLVHVAFRVAPGDVGVAIGLYTPIIGLWIVVAAAAVLMSHHRRLLLESRSELQQTKSSLEQQVLDRTRTIQEQQHRIIQDEKLRVMGRLAGGIAHDFNNILTGILGHSTILKLEAAPGSKVYAAAEVIERGALRGADITKQLLAYARSDKRRNGAVDLHHLIDEVCALLTHTLGRRIQIDRRYCTGPLLIDGDPAELHEAFVNLAINARDAMPEGGVLTFSTSLSSADAASVDPGRCCADTLLACVTVRDTGCGIPPDMHEKIFEPFVTTKEKGSGLGLAMVRRVVNRCQGAIRVESAAGEGTTFHLAFPLTKRLGAQDEGRGGELIVRGSGCVLLVDNEESVLQVEGAMLEYLGYTAVPVCSPVEAIELFRDGRDHIDAVILDMIMPELSGLDCLRSMRGINPSVPMLIATGTSDARVQEALDAGAAGLLIKPVSLHDLGATLARVLAERQRKTETPTDPPDRTASVAH